MNFRVSPLEPKQGEAGAARGGANAARAGTALARAAGFLRRHRLPVLVAAAAIIAYGGYSTFGGGEAESEPDTATVVRGNVENVVTAAGNLQPLNFVDVGAQVSGQLKNLHVNAGDEVQEGQLLAEIDAAVQAAEVASAHAQLDNLQAQLQERQAQLELARIQAQRQERLMTDNATSQEAYDSAKSSLLSAEAQVRSSQAQIEQARSTLTADEARLGYSKIYAPITGTVSSIMAKQGQTLNANQQAPTILQIADLSVMTVSTQVSEADVPRLRIGMDAYFTTLGSGERRWYGKLRQILPTPVVLNNVVLYTALFDVENPGHELMTQMTAQVFFVVEAAQDVVRAPVAALTYANRGGAARGTGGGQTEALAQRLAGGQAGNGPPRGGAQNGAAGARVARDQAAQTDGVTPRGRPATVTVRHEDGALETREVLVGVSDRINAEIISGLEEGEEVVVQVRGLEQRNNNQFRGFGGFGGGFGGFAP